MNRPEAGSAVAIIVLDAKGNEHTFRLALVKDNTFKGFDGTSFYDYKYVDDEGSMISGTYSGGITGSGILWRDVYVPSSTPNEYYDRYQVVSTDLSEINKIVDEINRAEEEKLQARKLEKELKEAAVAAQVELDKPIEIYEDENIKVSVTPRFYNTRNDRRFEVKCSFSSNNSKAWGTREQFFHVNDLFTPKGRPSVKATKLFGAAGPAIAIKAKTTQDNLYRIYREA